MDLRPQLDNSELIVISKADQPAAAADQQQPWPVSSH